MLSEELAQRQKRAAAEQWVINRTTEGLRVYSPASGEIYLVTGLPDSPECSCQDFQFHHSDPDWRCKHIIAVVNQFSEAPPNGAEPNQPAPAPVHSNGQAPPQMMLKRSVSPDGRIDSLSVEFSYPVLNGSADDLVAQAANILRLQDEIVATFLEERPQSRAGAPAPAPASSPVQPTPPPNGNGEPIPGQMLGIGGMDSQWGRRLFITIKVQDKSLRLFGSAKQLAEHMTRAGYPTTPADMIEGARFNLPCRVVTIPCNDGRYVNVEQLLPAQDLSWRQGMRP